MRKDLYVATLLFVASSFGSRSANAVPLFLGAVSNFVTGASPRSVALSDVNGDGKLDVVTANGSAGTISVLVNNGIGFATKVDYSVGSQPAWVAVADLNGDGKPDIVTANTGSNAVSVLLNNGDGTFAAKQNFPVGSAPACVAVGDVNGDGAPDLVTANTSSNTVSVLLNTGVGAFGPAVNYPVGSQPESVALGDVNGDGKPDIVAANYGASTVSVLANHGDGTYAAGVSRPTGSQPYEVAVADLNGDGKADIATVNYPAGTVSVLRNNGSGTFAAKVDYPAGTISIALAVADVNGDGKPDLVTADISNYTISVSLNNGNGTFAARTQYALSGEADALAIGDVNGDGLPDVVTANQSAATVSVMPNSGNGAFAANVDIPAGSAPAGMAVADLNRDGRPDIVTANQGVNSQGVSTVSVLLNSGNGAFATKTDYPVGSQAESVAVGDLDGDGWPDLVTANYGDSTVSVLRNNGNGTFAAKVDYAVDGTPVSVAVSDVNGDGLPDIVALTYFTGNSATVLINRGGGTFAAGVHYVDGPLSDCVVVADMNGDGKPDILFSNSYDSTVSILRNNGDGTFADKVNFTTGGQPGFVAVGDLNGDGKLDMVTANPAANTVSVLMNIGVGSGLSFAPAVNYATLGGSAVAVADVNADGKPDIIASDGAINGVSVFLNNGDGTVGAATNYAVGYEPGVLVVADLNGDFVPDLVTVNSGSTVGIAVGQLPALSGSSLLFHDAAAIHSAPTAYNGVAYFGDDAARVHAVNLGTGVEASGFPVAMTGANIRARVALYAAGGTPALYGMTDAGVLFRESLAGGAAVWTANPPGAAGETPGPSSANASTPAVDNDHGTVVVAFNDASAGPYVALFSAATGAWIASSPSLGSPSLRASSVAVDGANVYVGLSDPSATATAAYGVVLLNEVDLVVRATFAANEDVTAPPLIVGSTAYIATLSGHYERMNSVNGTLDATFNPSGPTPGIVALGGALSTSPFPYLTTGPASRQTTYVVSDAGVAWSISSNGTATTIGAFNGAASGVTGVPDFTAAYSPVFGVGGWLYQARTGASPALREIPLAGMVTTTPTYDRITTADDPYGRWVFADSTGNLYTVRADGPAD